MSPRVTPENRIPDIIRAAADVFSRRGYRLARMEEIAREAHVSKATIYYYFKSKIHLFYYLLENGVPQGGVSVPAPENGPPITEREMLKLLQKRLKKRTRLKSISDYLEVRPAKIDLAGELEDILGEMWDLQERNRIQIVILEKSADEFPELAGIYDKYARQQILQQLERYLESRARLGIIRSLNSIPVTARLIVESLAWFAWKQQRDHMSAFPFPKSEALPELISMFANGLKKRPS